MDYDQVADCRGKLHNFLYEPTTFFCIPARIDTHSSHHYYTNELSPQLCYASTPSSSKARVDDSLVTLHDTKLYVCPSTFLPSPPSANNPSLRKPLTGANLH